MVKKMSWDEFRSNGLLWAVNTFLHMFGCAIVVETDEDTGNTVNVYPARVDYRGFDDEGMNFGFTHLHNYLKNNIKQIEKETWEEEEGE